MDVLRHRVNRQVRRKGRRRTARRRERERRKEGERKDKREVTAGGGVVNERALEDVADMLL